MKDDEYFGFSMNGDFKEVDPLNGENEDDFKVVDLLDFESEDDIRIVNLSDIHTSYTTGDQRDAGSDWFDRVDSVRRKLPTLHSSSALRPRCTQKRHIIKSALVTALVIMGLLVFLGNSLWLSGKGSLHPTASSQGSSASASQSSTMAHMIAPPENAAPLIIDTNHYYIQWNANWTQVLLDGHSLLPVPIPGVDSPLLISAGHHLVMWQTSAYHSYSCTMTVPPSLLDTCDYNGPEALQNGIAVWIITLPPFKDGD